MCASALRVLRTRLRRDRDGLRAFPTCVELFGAASFPYLPAELAATFLPVLFLAGRPAVASCSGCVVWLKCP